MSLPASVCLAVNCTRARRVLSPGFRIVVLLLSVDTNACRCPLVGPPWPSDDLVTAPDTRTASSRSWPSRAIFIWMTATTLRCASIPTCSPSSAGAIADNRFHGTPFSQMLINCGVEPPRQRRKRTSPAVAKLVPVGRLLLRFVFPPHWIPGELPATSPLWSGGRRFDSHDRLVLSWLARGSRLPEGPSGIREANSA